MDKRFLVEQLGARVRESVQATHRSHVAAREDAKTGAARAVNLGLGHGLRETAAREALDALDAFRPRPLPARSAVELGAVVEVEDGDSGKTLFLAPVGAGVELEGPGGDGIFQVITPGSPFGRALMGKKLGDTVEVLIAGDPTDWTITYVA